jgi:hypothetical protein
METKRCLDDLKQYMSMYNLKADAPMADIKPYIKQIIKAGTTSKVFALFALDYMHGFKGTIDIKAFAADAVKTLTYYSEPQCRYKFDDRYLIDCDDIY